MSKAGDVAYTSVKRPKPGEGLVNPFINIMAGVILFLILGVGSVEIRHLAFQSLQGIIF